MGGSLRWYFSVKTENTVDRLFSCKEDNLLKKHFGGALTDVKQGNLRCAANKITLVDQHAFMSRAYRILHCFKTSVGPDQAEYVNGLFFIKHTKGKCFLYKQDPMPCLFCPLFHLVDNTKYWVWGFKFIKQMAICFDTICYHNHLLRY